MNSKRDQAEYILRKVYSFARSYRILLALLLLIGMLYMYINGKVVADNAHIRDAAALVSSTKADMEKLHAAESSFERYCWSYTSPEIDHTTTVTCYAELNAYFDGQNTQQMKAILSSEVRLLEKRGINVEHEPNTVNIYGFDYSDSACTLDADFERQDALGVGDPLDFPSSSHQRGHVNITCRTVISDITRMLGKY